MSGIFGIVGRGSREEMAAMAERMSYRGETWSLVQPAPGVMLGEIGKLPAPEDTAPPLVIDCSGNLLATRGVDASSTQVRALLAGELQREVEPVLNRLHGNWSLACWVQGAGALLLATDRHCYKTLYYATLGGRVAFASDYKALLALADCAPAANPDCVQEYLLTLECPETDALLEGVVPLAAARCAWLRPDGTSTPPRRWWTKRREPQDWNLQQAGTRLRSTLEAVVSRMTAGTRRLAITLSGGLDSTVLLALARRVRPDLEIATYTIGHGPDDPEILGARESARHFGTEHHEVIYDVRDIRTELPRFVWLTEDLMGREETLLQHAITRVIGSRGERTVMVGNGADLAFCGMPRHRLLWLRDHAPRLLRPALDDAFLYTQLRRPPTSLGGRLLTRILMRNRIHAPPLVPGLAPPASRHDFSTLASYQCSTIADKPFCYHEPLDAELGLIQLSPFSSAEVIDFALACPVELMVDRRAQKRVLRSAMADLLPPHMASRGKAIQRLRHDSSMSEALDHLADDLDLDGALARRGLLAPDYVRNLRRRRPDAAYAPPQLHLLWALVSTELWMRIFVEGRGAMPARGSGPGLL